MRILIINTVCGVGSTGRICTDLAATLEGQGNEVRIAYGRDHVPERFKNIAVRIGNDFDMTLHVLRTRLFDEHGLGSRGATKRFLTWANDYNPDVLWLHNIHGYYINYELLFAWIKSRPGMEVRWTLHDCWAFTGHCTYFTMAECDRWKDHCLHCAQKKQYPGSFAVDRSKRNFDCKKAAFTGVNNMTLITPSKWLADLVRQSFLGQYPVEVVYNTIDRNAFTPTPSNFRQRYNKENKKIVLGVASEWNKRKGLNDFVKLSSMLDSRYAIVLVGLSKKQIRELPKCITGLQKTKNVGELAAIYTAADIFVNPTYEDNYPTVNLEAEACGTPVITYDTGGCKEGIKMAGSRVVQTGDVFGIYKELLLI